MPNYGMPGVAVARRRATLVGITAIAVVLAVAVTWTVVTALRTEEGMRITLRTQHIGDGIVAGTHVRIDGVQVGDIEQIDSGGNGTQLLILRLDRTRLSHVTQNISVNYAPANLFGISELDLRPAGGGAPLSDNITIDLTGPQAERVRDVTMGALIRSLTRTSTGVLTPELTETLTAIAADLRAFTPLIETLIATGQAVADTQRLPASFLVGQFGSTLNGAAEMIGGTVTLIDNVSNIEILRTQRELFDAGVDLIIERFFPAIVNTGVTAREHFSAYADMATPALAVLSQMVPAPQASGEQLREILNRLGNSFVQTPQGPVLQLALTLRGVPALTTPLLLGGQP